MGIPKRELQNALNREMNRALVIRPWMNRVGGFQQLEVCHVNL